jgi:hypothetical protein
MLVAIAYLALWLPAAPATAAEPQSGGAPKRVLILQSFGSDFAHNTLSASFRSELAQSLGESLEFHEVSVQGTNSPDPTMEDALATYLVALGAGRPHDLAVAIGGQAGRFTLSHREQLFPATPVLYAGVDQRFVGHDSLTANDAAVLVANDVPAMVENILQVLPQTETVAVVIGSSPLERLWRAELGRELRPYESRVRLLWWDELTSREILDRAAELPPRSAILYTLFLVDAAGISHASQAVLSSLHSVASAPVFGLFDSQLGEGIVGGPVMSIDTLSSLCAEAAMRVLQETPADIRFPSAQGRRSSTGASSNAGASAPATCHPAAPSASDRRRLGSSTAGRFSAACRSSRCWPASSSASWCTGRAAAWPNTRSGR